MNDKENLTEDEMDIEWVKAYEAKEMNEEDTTTYTHEEVKKILGIEFDDIGSETI